MKITQQARKSFLKQKLANDSRWALRALVHIYNHQTADEQLCETTHYHNGVGFSGADANLLSSFAKQYLQRGRLSEKQMYYVHKKMPRYWRQILNLSDVSKLDNAIVS